MTWVKLDDRVTSHPKLLTAGMEAGWLWIASLCYANGHHTDGFIPTEALPMLCPGQLSKRKLNSLARKLEEVSLWIPTEKGWKLHDYLDYQAQATRAFIAEKREKERTKKASQRAKARGIQDLSPGDTSEKCPPLSPPCPSPPTRPDPSLLSSKEESERAREAPPAKEVTARSQARFTDPLGEIPKPLPLLRFVHQLWTLFIREQTGDTKWTVERLDGREQTRLRDMADWATLVADSHARGMALSDWETVAFEALRGSLTAYERECSRREDLSLHPGFWYQQRELWTKEVAA